MIIVCPRCETTFTLPDELYTPGKKARCSKCGLVFPMPAPPPAEASSDAVSGYGEVAPPLKEKKRFSALLKPALLGLSALCLLALLGYGAYLVYGALFGSSSPPSENAAKTAPSGTPPAQGADPIVDQAHIDSLIYLDEIRQYVVDNVHLGKVMFIQGLAVNKSDSNKDYVRARARLLDENKQVLKEAELFCGVSLTLFQVQNLTMDELSAALNNRVTIMTNNTNIPPGGKTPFVFVFPNPPDTVRRFEVTVTEVRESPHP